MKANKKSYDFLAGIDPVPLLNGKPVFNAPAPPEPPKQEPKKPYKGKGKPPEKVIHKQYVNLSLKKEE